MRMTRADRRRDRSQQHHLPKLHDQSRCSVLPQFCLIFVSLLPSLSLCLYHCLPHFPCVLDSFPVILIISGGQRPADFCHANQARITTCDFSFGLGNANCNLNPNCFWNFPFKICFKTFSLIERI